MILLILKAQQTVGMCTLALNSFKDCIFTNTTYMTFLDIATKPALNAESRRCFLLPRTTEIRLSGHLWSIRYCLVEVIMFSLNTSLKGREKRGKYRDREPLIVKISHESKTEWSSEAAIWQWMRMIG